MSAFLVLLFLAAPSFAQDSDYGQSRIAQVFTQNQLTHLLEAFVNQVQGVGFLDFGYWKDSFHFHILGREIGEPGEKRYEIYALLYHTQEERHRFVEAEDLRYTDLSYQKRSWIQWVNDASVELASKYIHENYILGTPTPGDQESYYSTYWRDYFTVLAEMLEPSKIQIPDLRDFGQVNYYDVRRYTNLPLMLTVNPKNSESIPLSIESAQIFTR